MAPSHDFIRLLEKLVLYGTQAIIFNLAWPGSQVEYFIDGSGQAGSSGI